MYVQTQLENLTFKLRLKNCQIFITFYRLRKFTFIHPGLYLDELFKITIYLDALL